VALSTRPVGRRSRAVLVRILVVVASAAALVASSDQPATAADYRCFYGPGIQVWVNSPPSTDGTRTWIMCGKNIQLKELWNYVENNNGARWSDQISAFETFNMPSGQQTVFYHDPCWKGAADVVTGNVLVSWVGSAYNDTFSSVSSPVTSKPSTC